MTTETKLTKRQDNLPEQTHSSPKVSPFVDIFENDEEILLLADMPGVAKDDLEVRIDKDVLVLEGTKTIGIESGLLRSECQSCTYERSFSLPPTIDGDKITAGLEHGVLTVHLPKRESVKPRQIAVTAG